MLLFEGLFFAVKSLYAFTKNTTTKKILDFVNKKYTIN